MQSAPQIEPSCSLNPEKIRVLNWNIQKQIRPQWHQDLRHLSSDIDLALFQEVHYQDHFLGCFEEDWCHSFATGYCSRSRTTGVMTLAAVDHLTHNHLVTREPLLRTPKATNITTYGLHDCEQTLLVINLHAVNFSLGLRAYQRQLHSLKPVLEAHEGPVILAGDFNTWHPRRERLMRAFADHFTLEEVLFEEDHRSQVFGYCLDYMFTRGLSTVSAVIHLVDTSDHNPMLASLSL